MLTTEFRLMKKELEKQKRRQDKFLVNVLVFLSSNGVQPPPSKYEGKLNHSFETSNVINENSR